MKETIRARIVDFVSRAAREAGVHTSWRTPLVGFASAADPLFAELKGAVSPSHALPRDLLPEARTVIAFFLPFDRGIAAGNVRGEAASAGWARAYIETNAALRGIGEDLKAFLEAGGHAAATVPATHNFDPRLLVSDWSHRHVAWVAGLGTFGLNNMLITESGCCGRFGSLIVSAEIPPDPRPEGEACLHRAGIPCALCVKRCVGGALREDGFDRHACYAACLRNEALHGALGKADVCGKCLVGLPCTMRNPVAARPGSG